MKRLVISALVIALAIFTLVGCASTKKASTDEITLELEANHTTGCSWIVSVEDESIAKFLGSEYVPNENPNGLVGVGGHEVLTFKCLKQGSTTVKLDYGHAWAPDEVYDKKTATITVNADLSGSIKLDK